MKHVFLIVGLCLITSAAFAQKAAVTGAERMAKDQRSNISEARKLIQGAMTNAETKDDPKTWFVAGQVEDAQFNRENTKQLLGQAPNEPLMYEALANSLPLFVKAYELDQLPNAKGKVAPKFTKNIKNILSINHPYFLNGGGYYFGVSDYKKAYDFFEQYLEIADLPFFKGEKPSARDENFMQVQFFAGIAAAYLEDSELAIKALNRAKDWPFRQNDVYGYLIYEYSRQKDSLNMEKTLEEGMKLFPDSSFYMLNLINMYIFSDRKEKAVNLLNEAIAKDPTNAQLYQALGSVYESGYKDNTKAEENFKKSLDLDPENPDALSNLGRIYFNQGIEIVEDANQIQDVQQFNAQKEIAKNLFNKALPYFQKAHQLKPAEFEYMLALRGIYYQLAMTKEFEEIEAKMGGQE